MQKDELFDQDSNKRSIRSKTPLGPEEIARRYPVTRWSLVMAAADGNEKALNDLCESYWFPIYGAFFDKVQNHHDAEDLSQRFFADILRRQDLRKLDRERGLFRAFLKTSIGNMFANFVDESNALKRGGGKTILSISEGKAEEWLRQENPITEDPGVLFDRRWIFSLLEIAKTDLRRSYAEQGKQLLFEELEDFLLTQARTIPYSEIAARLNIKAGTARVNAHRIRARYRELIRIRIHETVDKSAQVDEELRYLSGLIGIDMSERQGIE